jgi:hypothetical protein
MPFQRLIDGYKENIDGEYRYRENMVNIDLEDIGREHIHGENAVNIDVGSSIEVARTIDI